MSPKSSVECHWRLPFQRGYFPCALPQETFDEYLRNFPGEFYGDYVNTTRTIGKSQHERGENVRVCQAMNKLGICKGCAIQSRFRQTAVK